MSEAVYVDRAVSWSKALTRMRARGPGDTENAMRAIERDYGVDYWVLWRLRYRAAQVRSVTAAIYHQLHAAYEAECGRQVRKLRHEIETTKQIAGASHASVAAAQSVLDEVDE